MIPIVIQVSASRSNIKVKGNVDLPYLVQLKTQQCFVLEASDLVGG